MAMTIDDADDDAGGGCGEGEDSDAGHGHDSTSRSTVQVMALRKLGAGMQHARICITWLLSQVALRQLTSSKLHAVFGR